MARIELDEINLSYAGGGDGIFDISLGIEDGEFLALLGPSGSGKTTLLRLVGGFLRPDSGSISIGGRAVADPKSWVPPEHRNLGMVFQQHAIWPHRSVGRNVEYPLKMAKVSKNKREERVREVLELVGLAGFGGRSPDTLSGGQQQRVALARALVVRPDALLLDEPFASLDAALRERLRVELGNLAERTQTTVIHVTHDRTEALALADHIAVIKDGGVEQLAPPRELFEKPQSPFVAEFVGDSMLVSVDRHTQRCFTPKGSNTSFEVGQLFEPQETRRSEGTLAIRPVDVGLQPGKGASVESAHFMGEALEVYLRWEGYSLKAKAPATEGYRSGDSVFPIFNKGVFFPAP